MQQVCCDIYFLLPLLFFLNKVSWELVTLRSLEFSVILCSILPSREEHISDEMWRAAGAKREKKKAEERKPELEFLLHEQTFWIFPEVLLVN